MIRVYLPEHLRTLAKVSGELVVEVRDPVTIAAVLDAVEARHPVLLGTIRDRYTRKRRAYVRYFACRKDLSLGGDDTPLPEAVVRGEEPFLVIGATAGG